MPRYREWLGHPTWCSRSGAGKSVSLSHEIERTSISPYILSLSWVPVSIHGCNWLEDVGSTEAVTLPPWEVCPPQGSAATIRIVATKPTGLEIINTVPQEFWIRYYRLKKYGSGRTREKGGSFLRRNVARAIHRRDGLAPNQQNPPIRILLWWFCATPCTISQNLDDSTDIFPLAVWNLLAETFLKL